MKDRERREKELNDLPQTFGTFCLMLLKPNIEYISKIVQCGEILSNLH